MRSLAAELPDILLNSKAKSTVGNYSGAVQKWTEWASKYNRSAIPAEPFDVSMFLVHLSHSARSPAPLTRAIAAISWAHKLAGVADPTKSSLVGCTYEGLKRKLAKPINKKEPITTDIIHQLVAKYLPNEQFTIDNLMNLRTVTMCVVAFAGFFRFNELVHIKLEHLDFVPGGVNIFIPSSKTDVYRSGKHVMISKGHTTSCPIRILNAYISLANLQQHQFIFRSLSKTNGGYKLRDMNQPMSYTRARECILDLLRPVVGDDDISKFGVHSLRSGGVTAAANAGVNDRLLKRHGRWKTDLAKDGYIKDDIQKILSVSRSLGL